MSVYDTVVGQAAAVAQLSRAASPEGSLAQAWLVAGPPGSGRSSIARAFAASLLCDNAVGGQGCGECQPCRTVLAGSHGDVTGVRTETLTISKNEVRELVSTAQRAPASGRHRVLIIEDADRMSPGTFNVLLKAIEEPPPRTVWLLCVPSPQDLAQTIRSRCRVVNLQVPPPDAVAMLLIERDGVEPELAHRAAASAQGHIGIARRYGLHPDSLAEREDSARKLLALTSVGHALAFAKTLIDRAEAEAHTEADEASAREREQFMRGAGIEPGGRIPPALRAQVKALDDEAKRRATRLVRDVIDRYLLDIHSVLRDVLTLQLNTGATLVNPGIERELRDRTHVHSPQTTLALLDCVGTARERVGMNVPPQLALEALLAAIVAAR
ncbi:DNA polymerase III subunit delta' [Dermabacter sp. p3-SID358]|uniref:DNA polymerase III subunit delta' n=1 Tax=Dermabacter sp. p3-SID358 TaxID=2916114 RepID=UPI0021A3A96D|nr:DNA polymerase III subunit delta' [Dermabacter sp. p3-SID358]MCT1866925.1 DNA polymerase III subunit delta' [Dermabacter sp. p3-SID358]